MAYSTSLLMTLHHGSSPALMLVGKRSVSSSSSRKSNYSSTNSASPDLHRIKASRLDPHTTTSIDAGFSDRRPLSRNDFPADFAFGAGVSAFQVEGAPYAGGRGMTIWDSFTQKPGKIDNADLNYPSCRFYEMYEEDIKHAKEIGFTSFRLSISWTRIYPEGGQPGEVASPEGIKYYNKVINAIVREDMTPFITLFHWEVPQCLENDPQVLGFRTKNIVPYFEKLADTCFKHFGDRVKHWVTINEMWVFCIMGYARGTFAPGRCSAISGNNCHAGDSQTECYLVGHNLLLAHAKVYQLYKNKYKTQQQGVCGFNPVYNGAAPYSDNMEDKIAVERYLEFNGGWQLDPVFFGDYPKSMRDTLGERLPKFTPEESEELKNSLDFIGQNYYTAYFIKHAKIPKDPSLRWQNTDGGYTTHTSNEKNQQIGPVMGPSNSRIRNSPKYLTLILEWMNNRYGRIPIYITENGCMDINPNNSIESLDDTQRIGFIKDHLTEISKSIKDKGINVKGYYYWSFLDNFEWKDGYNTRYGLVRVDFESDPPRRTNKASATWFQKFLVNN